MPLFNVTHNTTITAETPEAAAIEVDRLLSTTRPKRFSILGENEGPIVIQVERGQAKRIA